MEKYLQDYHKAKAFSGFLPGISGVTGIPIWCFYVNRGQGISGFGIGDKDHPMMEFFPANLAYQYVTTYGFRTFLKWEDETGKHFAEPFQGTGKGLERRMGLSLDSIFLEEYRPKEHLRIQVQYATVSDSFFGGLIRNVEITNEGEKELHLEVVDGMPAILPYGATNSSFKEMGNLMRSWMEVSHVEKGIPYYHFRASTKDQAEVSELEGGFFFWGLGAKDTKVHTIVDPKVLFHYQTDLTVPVRFEEEGLSGVKQYKQYTANKVPCGFQGLNIVLQPGENRQIPSVYGYIGRYDRLVEFTKEKDLGDWVDHQIEISKNRMQEETALLATETAFSEWDLYFRQCYLDNFLRGGKPLFLGEKKKVPYHIYSRKHGDQEREYNFFFIEPNYFSQGNGNYRDINQNRRHDVSLDPRVGDFNIWMFYNLIQMDGYNPLVVNGIRYRFDVTGFHELQVEFESLFSQEQRVALEKVLGDEFSPGSLIRDLDLYELPKEQILLLVNKIIDRSKPVVKATFGEGYWSDHFTYNLDLIEDYLKIFPEKRGELLLRRMDYGIFQSPERVLPRSEKIGLRNDGQVRQYGALEKVIQRQGDWIKDQEGNPVHTHLLDKLLLLLINKYCSLDAAGIGIEMEGNKPGWNDAMNGLPGLLGSGVGETVELLRIVRFLEEVLSEEGIEEVDTLAPIAKVLMEIEAYQVKKQELTEFERWDLRSTIKEVYRSETDEVVSGDRTKYSVTALLQLLQEIEEDLQRGLERGIEENKGILPTYLSFEVNKYERIGKKTPYGLEAIRIVDMSYRYLPNFLEAPARYLKVSDEEKARKSYEKIRASKLYDEGIQMYVTSEPLDEESMEIGRIRAFTPGWLERESVFLHMIYKYLLGLMKAGLWQEFYHEIKTHGIPFLDPEVYGRPTYENSSFLASSRNPDPEVVGQGFVARLSGSTIEAISMWQMLFVGKEWFKLKDGQLYFSFEPNLAKEWFDEEDKVSFTFLSGTKVTYHNSKRQDLFVASRPQIEEMIVDKIRWTEPFFVGEDAERLRKGEYKEVQIYY